MADFEVQAELILAAGIAYRGNGFAAVYPFSDVLEKRLIMGIKTHITIPMVNYQEQPGG